MLPRDQRVSRKKFPVSMKNSLSFYGEFFTLRVCPNKDKNNLFACVVSKKVSPLATQRNLLRRRVYAILQKQKLQKKSKTFVFYPKKEARVVSFDVLKQDIEDLIEKALPLA